MISWLRAFLHRHFSADKEGAESEARLQALERRLAALDAVVDTRQARRVDHREGDRER